MFGNRLMVILACATAGFGTVAAAQFASPKPEVFAREEDRSRARLSSKPCTKADMGRGCYGFGGRAIREGPCSYHINARTIGRLPIDQCYRMEASRRYRGVWVDEFEGQAFIPEGTKEPEWPRGDLTSAELTSSERRKQFDQLVAARIWLDVERVNVGHNWRRGGRRMLIEFDGRKTMYRGNYGHMGMWGHLVIVDRVISLKECHEAGDCHWSSGDR